MLLACEPQSREVPLFVNRSHEPQLGALHTFSKRKLKLYIFTGKVEGQQAAVFFSYVAIFPLFLLLLLFVVFYSAGRPDFFFTN